MPSQARARRKSYSIIPRIPAMTVAVQSLRFSIQYPPSLITSHLDGARRHERPRWVKVKLITAHVAKSRSWYGMCDSHREPWILAALNRNTTTASPCISQILSPFPLSLSLSFSLSLFLPSPNRRSISTRIDSASLPYVFINYVFVSYKLRVRSQCVNIINHQRCSEFFPN
jgi:hypothetical protein